MCSDFCVIFAISRVINQVGSDFATSEHHARGYLVQASSSIYRGFVLEIQVLAFGTSDTKSFIWGMIAEAITREY